jgi:protein-disulfide isomerase
MSAHAPDLVAPITPHDHVRGPTDAPVQLVIYGDFECGYCGQTHLILQAILDKMGDQVCIVFRHFPLTDKHPHAEHAAEAAEAAGAQRRFWEMHDMMFENQDALDDDDLLAYAGELGVDTDRFADEIVSGAHTDRIRHNRATGMKSGVDGTPTIFINGARYTGELDIDSLMKALKSQL